MHAPRRPRNRVLFVVRLQASCQLMAVGCMQRKKCLGHCMWMDKGWKDGRAVSPRLECECVCGWAKQSVGQAHGQFAEKEGW